MSWAGFEEHNIEVPESTVPVVAEAGLLGYVVAANLGEFAVRIFSRSQGLLDLEAVDSRYSKYSFLLVAVWYS